MTMQFTQITVDDFSGGITDYILAAKPNQSAVIQNLLIDPNKKLGSSPGSQIYDPAMYITPNGGNQRVTGIFASIYPQLLINSARQIWRPNVSAFAEFLGPSGNPALSVGTTADFPAFAEWNQHIFVTNTAQAAPIKIYQDGSGVWQTRTAGLPALASAPTVTGTAGTGLSYVYAFLYHYSYTVVSTNFEDFGPSTLETTGITYNTGVGTPISGTNPVSVSAIPVLANGATGNYDTANVTVYIYRTTANTSTYYKVGQVTNGTTTFSDSMTDATALINGTLLYTNSGVLDNDTPPLAKYITIVNGVAYYGNIKQGAQTFKNRVQQSVANDPDSCPGALFVDFLDEVTGLSSYNDNPIVFTKSHVYRLNGQYSALGQGQVTYEDITKTVGCVSHQSIVQTRYGVFWAGNDGFYWTDGFNFLKVSDNLNERYKTFVTTATSASRIWGTYDTKDNRVYWAVTANASSPDNDSFLVLDLRWGISATCSFTTRVNGSDLAPTCLTFYQGQLIRGDRRGFIFKHDAQYATDPSIDTTAVPSLWGTSGIIPLYQSIVSNLGFPNVRKWTTKCLLTMNNVSNVSVQISSINDNSTVQSLMKEIRYRGNVLWGDPTIFWGAATPNWADFSLVEQMRNFPAMFLRCSYKQMQITQAFTIVYNSDSIATATVSNGAKTAVLTDVTQVWPTDLKTYYISFENDGYVANYQILTRTATTLTYLDPQGTSPTGLQKWVIRGFPKGEIFSIVSYVIYFAPLTSQSYKTYRTEQDSNGGNS
jgi:hypothetical protein